ncbi:MAG: rhomboid family intramembrane serine protease [Planctomycetes bacterium]|nr:rhomboid family intramembrane serine protease [Planctomycetota bacterium]
MFFPIGDENPTQRAPYVNYVIIGVNILVFSLINYRPWFGDVVKTYGWTPANGEFITLFTSMFMHAGFFHILFNMWYLWIFGDNVEDQIGPYYYIGFYLLAGISADLLHTLIDPSSTIPCIGASGAISGVMGFYIIFFPLHKIKVLYILGRFINFTYLNALIMLGFWFFLQLLYGFLSTGMPGMGGVAYWAHIGGFLFGVAFAIAWKTWFSQQRKKEIRQTIGSEAVITGAKRISHEDPNILLGKSEIYNNEAEYLYEFNHAVRVFGEMRIRPEYHLRAGEIFQNKGNLQKAAEIYERFILAYPFHPITQKLRYFLGLVYTHPLNRPDKGLKYLSQTVKEPGEGYSLEEAREELRKLEAAFNRITADKKPEELDGDCIVIRQTLERINYYEIAPVIAQMTGQQKFDVLRYLRNSGGVIAKGIPPSKAVEMADYLKAKGVPVLILDQSQAIPLPPEQRVVKAEIGDKGIHLSTMATSILLGWDDIYLAIAGRFQLDEHRIIQGPAKTQKFAGVSGYGVAMPKKYEMIEKTETRITFRIDLITNDFTGRFDFNTEQTTIIMQPDAGGYQTKEIGLSLLADKLSRVLECKYSNLSLKLLANKDFNEAHWKEQTFPARKDFDEYVLWILNLKKYG